MFNSCTALKEVIWNNLSLPLCTAITSMFRYCYNLEKIEMKNWSIPSLTTAPTYIFSECWKLRKVDIDIPINLNYSFGGCHSLSH